ncbi:MULTISPECIES: dTMP kinase [Arthrobacter]|uniref:dTMP kinase n=1 Tax=unclassified Arthrobacter TaxID=235627 RepID=UPI0024BA3607|nr:dTMP kinase [Arthrobacter sp. H35-MC1]MDJ0318026.1 dTMP kinase [Arthrobacter sp. H35-MC1]
MTHSLAPAPGLFIAFEGGDGAGKSTQAALLTDVLSDAGREVRRTREPGGTPVGEKLRSLVLEHGQGEIDAKTEALIFAAARAAHAAQVIVPAVARGEIVISDRYADSSIAYQGAGRGLGTQAIVTLNEWATDGLWPDLTVLLDVTPADGRNRRTAGDATEDRMESEPDHFHATIRAAFLELASAHPQRYLVLPAKADIAELAAAIKDRVLALLAAEPAPGPERSGPERSGVQGQTAGTA